MRGHTNLTIDSELRKEFQNVYGGSISRFLEQQMIEYLEKMGLKWWLICPECKQRSH